MRPAAAQAVSMAPYTEDMRLVPNTSAMNEGITAKPPPKHSKT